MSSIADQLFDTLQAVQSPGNFYATGKMEIFPPHLEVEGVGRIALPLLSMQAEQLVAVAEVAPYGLGQETLIDTTVRRTWQIDANRLTLDGKYWQKNLTDIVSRVAEGLGVTGNIKAELYKMLVYDAGSFFVSHRDTEKAEGMFATMVIVLPSEYSGGELLVNHKQQQVKLDLHCDDPSEVAFAAFYADCVHEVLPITQGCRLTLIYNLMRTDKKMSLPLPPDYSQEQNNVTHLLRNWAAVLNAGMHEEAPEKLIYLLEHAYSSAEFGFDALKGADAAVAEVLLSAAGEALCDIHLALVSVAESGNAEYAGSGRYWEHDEDDFEEGEVFERTETVSEWRRPDGKQSNLPNLPFSEHEFCPPDAFSDIELDDVQFQEATGNAGASFERTYHCAALVIWPKSQHLAIINQAGLSEALTVLRDFCQRLATEDKAPHSSLWNEAHLLAGYMLRDWLPQLLGIRYASSNNTIVRDYLDCLYRLRDRELLVRFWSMLAENGFYNKADCAVLVQTVELLPWSEVVSWTEKAISASAVQSQAACAALLAGLSASEPDQARNLTVAARTVFKSLPGDPKRFAHLQFPERSRINPTTDLVVDVLVGFSAIDPTLAEEALNYQLAWPEIYIMDNILVPAALQLTEMTSSRDLAVVAHLRQAVSVHLRKRVAEVLEAPADWRRESKMSCTCQDCAQLRTFLDNPAQSQWAFKAAEVKRSHLEQIIRRQQCDLDCVTERKSRPYSLICTKNQASYLKRVKQRKNDLDVLARLTQGSEM
jgi:predicted 2-oxoglutarate/Fe(II)-dependent dioxygenase YbiX